MSQLFSLLQDFNGLVWGAPMLLIILGTGIYLTFGLRFIAWRKLPEACRQLVAKPAQRDGEISAFSALMTSLSAT
ncbi:MAG: sodium:alanine symporter family protein, partial [Gammaproteobacteria bacterium]|nr:sodium:alanine symporter family protein [Gammaproteobacteria bacterium]